jgi:hypothetical protein
VWLGLAVLGVAPPAEAAGLYSVYSCHRPDGSGAPVERWTGQAPVGYAQLCTGSGEVSDAFHVQLPVDTVPAFSYAALTWTPPAGVRPAAITLLRSLQSHPTTAGRLIARLNNPSALPEARYVRDSCSSETGCANRDGTITIRGLADGPIYLIVECRDAPCDDGNPDPLRGWGTVDFVAPQITFELAEVVPPSVTAVGGSLTGPGPHFGSQEITYRALDNGSGVYRHHLRIDGATVVDKVASSNAGRCRDPFPSNADRYEFDYAQPCAARVDGRIAVNLGSVSQGAHQVQLSVEDAAGNETVAYRGSIDVVSDPATRSIDTGGIAGLFNPLGGVPGLALNGSNGGGGARLDAYLVSRRAGRSRHVARRTITWPGEHVAGLGLSRDGGPVSDAQVVVVQRQPGGQWSAVSTVRTSLGGRATYRVPTGPSRQLRFVYFPSSESVTFIESRTLSARVASRTTLRVAPHTVRNGQRVRFNGRVVSGPQPATGVLVALQARVSPRRWITFRLTRASAGSGRFRASYRFSATRGTFAYRFRAVVKPQPGYPFATGRSNTVRVLVRG